MNSRYLNNIMIFCLFLFNFLTVIDSEKQRIERGDDEKKFIKCLEENSLTSCLILLFINERQEKLLLQIQNELSK